MLSIEGRSIIITGGGSGLGAGTAAHFAARGAQVTICGRRAEKIEAVAEGIGDACTWVHETDRF
jgi:3-oxoacyl-[acyl-carrier protein] reductase